MAIDKALPNVRKEIEVPGVEEQIKNRSRDSRRIT